MSRAVVRLVAVLAFSAAALPGFAQEKPAGPQAAATLLKAAFAKATAEKKTIWIEFGASSCVACARVEAFLRDPDVSKIIAANYVVVNLTVQETPENKALENPGGQALLGQLGGDGEPLPFFAYLDGKGRKIADSKARLDGGSGFPGNATETPSFLKLLEKTSLHLNDASRAKIVEYLAKNVPQ